MVVLGCLLWPMTARAEPDNRLGDRFFFALQAGGVSASSATAAEPIKAEGDAGSISLGLGYETSYWPNDYFGVGLNLQIMRIPGNANVASGTNVDLGLPIMLAVPLRYVQPYAGVWLGLANTYVDHIGRGVRAALHPLAGVNGYINRNLRLFLQWEQVSFHAYSETDAQLVVAGARWSPDFYHEMRGTMKFQTIWWSVLGTLVGWGVASLAVGD